MKKKIFADSALNIFATVTPMMVLNILILPLVASKIDSSLYGELISVVALVNLFGGTAGNVLNNLRLINYKKYFDRRIVGDYNILLIILILISLGMLIIYMRLTNLLFMNFSIILILLITIFLILKGYARVEFRLKLNFKYILYDSMFLLFGYLVGFAVFLISKRWEYIYLLGFLFSFFWIYKKTAILKEPFLKTIYFHDTKNQLVVLYISAILTSLGMYVDKLLIYPLLGGSAVSIYYASTVLGKSFSVVIQPLTSVMLSYLAHFKSFKKNKFNSLMVLSIILGVIFYFAILFASKFVLSIIYPKYVSEAIKYINITTASIIVTVLSNIINSVLLKFRDVKWQLAINATYIITYFSFSILLLKAHGLTGFCLGILIASIIRLSIMLFAYYYFERTEY